MAVNQLIYNGKTYERLRKASCNLSESLSLSALPIDTLTATIVEETDTQPLISYSYGSIVKYFHNGNLIGKFYLEKIEQVGKWDWSFQCVSPIGLLENTLHWGGVYTGQPAKDVIADIIGGVIPYSIDDRLKDIPIYGWLKKDTKRANLRNLLFSINARVVKNREGDCHFFPMLDGGKWNMFTPYVPIQSSSYILMDGTPYLCITDDPYDIDSNVFYLNGGSVTKGTPATQAQVTEHSYFKSDSTVLETVFEGSAVGSSFTSPKNQTMENAALLEFSKPYYDYSIEGSEILESDVNYVIVRPSSNCVVKAKPFIHSERTLFRNGTLHESPNIVRSNACHLVNMTNSDSVADRVIAFYGYAKKTTVDMVFNGEKPGDYVKFITPFGEPLTGFIESLNLTMSKDIKARATLVSGYIPPSTQTFRNRVVLTGSGEWTVPNGITKIRYALFQGAFGGGCGKKGGDSEENIVHSYSRVSIVTHETVLKGKAVVWGGPGGKGGQGGDGGLGSRVKEGEMNVTEGQKLQYSCGIGGYGANYGEDVGMEGSITTLNGVSSEDGNIPSEYGWVDIITGEVYCTKGSRGLSGGNGAGAKKDYVIPKDSSNLSEIMVWEPQTGAYDENGTLWPGAPTKLGREGHPEHDNLPWAPEYFYSTSDGTQGASAGYGLGPGGVAGVIQNEPTERGKYSYDYAVSPNGLTPPAPSAIPKKATPTNGGRGGYGGGGGSSSGWAQGECDPSEGASVPDVTSGSIGIGGPGGKGGQGGDGIIIIYY